MNILDAYNMKSDMKDAHNAEDISLDGIKKELELTKELCGNLDKVIENSLDGIFITDGEGKIIRVNHSYENLSGLKREDIIGMNMMDFEKKYISESCTLIVLKEKKAVTIEQLIKYSNKKVLVTCNPIFNVKGEVTLVVSNVRDMTEIEFLKRKISKDQELVSKYKKELELIKKELDIHQDFIAEDSKMLEVLYTAQHVARVDSTVLLLGETGVGKEVAAKYIHRNSKRAAKSFIKINCGAIPENLIESELFGYEKGAFTGANTEGKMGLFEVANGGTIFLDEIGEMSLDMQVKLLRTLQDGEIERVGGIKPINVDVRVIAATNKDLTVMMKEGTFREDLYYRINVVPIKIPPLRERQDDIIPLSENFVDMYNKKYDYHKKLSKKVKYTLSTYSWPGNVRELKNLIERAVIMSATDEVLLIDIPISGTSETLINTSDDEIPLKQILEQVEKEYILKTYQEYKSVRSAAKHLGMKHSTFANRLNYYKEKSD